LFIFFQLVLQTIVDFAKCKDDNTNTAETSSINIPLVFIITSISAQT